jgi:hypothetical protein
MQMPFNASEEQLRAIFDYAEKNDIALSEVISITIERQEDEIGSRFGHEAVDILENVRGKTIPHSEFWKGQDVL